MSLTLPYWRLSGFYFFYFAFVGAISPFWGLYLKSLEFSAFQIGILMSLLQVMRIFAPNIWGWAADRNGKRVAIVQVAAMLSLVSYIGVFFGTSFLWLFIVMSLLSFFWSASLPLVEATTLSHLGERTEKYGRIRLWGSVGFIFSVVVLGYVLDFVPIRFLLWAILGMMIGLVLLARHIPEAMASAHHTDSVPAWQVIKQPVVLAFFAASFFNAAAHGPYYTFYSIYLVDHGYSKSSVGWLWALGVICEILVFLWMPRLMRRFSLRQILLTSFALGVLRFLFIAWGIGSVGIVLLAQVLHAGTFGSAQAATIEVIHRLFRGRHQAKGQALSNSLSFGAGGTLGGLYAGYAWDALGPQITFTIAAACAGIAFLLVYWKLELHTIENHRQHRQAGKK
ncbi:MAG: MFS transporter [Sulfuricella denitrificans]|nr:MFS transporter [Sulfuricella denitrificans]